MRIIRQLAVPQIALWLLVFSAVPVGAQSADPSPVAPLTTGAAAAWVTGTLVPAPDCTGPDSTTTAGGVVRTIGIRCAGEVVTMSDRRLSGTSNVAFNQDVHPVSGDRSVVVAVRTYDLRNEDGSWRCHDTSLVHGESAMGGSDETSVCVGSGAYEGLGAILVFDWTACQPQFTLCIDSPVRITGALFTGELPPAP